MYVGEPNNPDCKRNANICITSFKTNDSIIINTKEQYRRNVIKDGEKIHEVGDFKFKKIPAIRPLTDITSAWKNCKDYPTVSYGLNCFRREVLIIDSDYTYTSLNQLKSYVLLFCNEAHLPEPSYILRNPKSGHGQIGWFMSTPFESINRTFNFSDFNASIKALALCWNVITELDGDYCFNGPACKNPFYSGFESYINNNVVNTYYFIDALNKARGNVLKSCKYNSSSSSLEAAEKLTKQSTKKSINRRLCQSDKGRNCYIMNNLRTRIFRFMNTHNGMSPTVQEAMDMACEINDSFSSRLDIKEISSIVKSVRPWCIDNYKADFIKHNDTTNARRISIIVKKCNKIVLMADALAGKISVSRGTLARYKAMTEEELKDLFSYKNTFLNYINSIRENCYVLNESFNGYIILEEKLENIRLEDLKKNSTTTTTNNKTDVKIS